MRLLRLRRGVTLIEMMLALTLFLVVFGIAVPFFRYEARSVSASAARQDALQNARYAQNAIDRDLRIAGIGIVSKQPLIVQADPYSITFNADLVTRDPDDAFSIYYDPDADSLSTISMSKDSPVTLPLSTQSYPDSDYLASSMPSRAETISYWVTADSASGRSDQYVLWRRVNNGAPRLVAKNIILESGHPLFTYFRPGPTGSLDSIPVAKLPIFHSAAIHASPADTGTSAWTDSIRVVRIRISGLYDDPVKGDIIRTVESSSKLINSGMVGATTCGDPPLPPDNPVATYDTSVLPAKITIEWDASIDQDNGEKDVERYKIFRKSTSASTWDPEPIASVAAGGTHFSIDDSELQPGGWQYAIVAQDCSPSDSPNATTNTVTVPTP